jgi:hypothetical protein
MAEYLVVSDAVSPVSDGEDALSVAGLARALVASKHRVTVLSLAAPDVVGRVPGMARRLRTVGVAAGGSPFEVPLYEGRVPLSQAELYVLGTPAGNRGEVASVLATAAASLAKDGLLKPDVLIAWGDTAAESLATVTAEHSMFVLPTGLSGRPLSRDERQALGPNAALDALASDSLTVLGAAGADTVVVPSPSSRAALERDPALAERASDQPLVAVRFGCDEAPHDPSSDPALPAVYGPEAPAGKAESRKALARRTSLALGPRTLLLTTPPLSAARGGKALIEALARVIRLDVAVAVPAGGDRALTDQAAVLGIEHPGKIAVVADGGPGSNRAVLAGADAVLLTDVDDHTGRSAGLALRYGVLPLVPEAGADADYLVDYDSASGTGCALLYSQVEPFELEGAVRRALALRANADAWTSLIKALMSSAPRWSATAAMLEALEPPPETTATGVGPT